MAGQFTAADFDEAASTFIKQGRFNLAHLAIKNMRRLRSQGERSTTPTAPSVEDYEEAAINRETGQAIKHSLMATAH
jgi:hypothetical protein